MDRDIVILLLGIGIVLTVGIGIVLTVGIGILHLSSSLQEKEEKIEAQKILDFKQSEHTCNELRKLYLKYENVKYNSFVNSRWFNEIRSTLIGTDCISNEELGNMEFINMCYDGKTIGCKISKLENPELYENFNFEKALSDKINEREFHRGK